MKLLFVCFVKCLPLTLLLGSLFLHPYLADNHEQIEAESTPQASHEIEHNAPGTDHDQTKWIEVNMKPD